MNTKNRLITIVSSIALAAFCAIGVSNASPRPRLNYSLTDLGVLPEQPDSIPAAVNNQGQVAGTSGTSAFRYSSIGKMEEISKNAKGVSRGFGVNGSGVVVGDSTFGKGFSHAAVFSNGSVTDLGTLQGVGNFSRANGINASGQVVGSSSTTLDGASSRAFIVSTISFSGTMIDIGTLGGAHAQALAINDAGFVTGNSQTYSGDRPDSIHAFIWHAPTGPLPDSVEIASNPSRLRMLDLGTLDGDFSYGTAISSKNHVAGYSTINNVDSRVHAFLYNGEKMLDLGSLSGASLDLDFSYALGVNSADLVVGYTYLPWENDMMEVPLGPWPVAFIYGGGSMRDLNGLIGDAAKNYRLDRATAINDNGQIVAIAYNKSAEAFHAVLLTPLFRIEEGNFLGAVVDAAPNLGKGAIVCAIFVFWAPDGGNLRLEKLRSWKEAREQVQSAKESHDSLQHALWPAVGKGKRLTLQPNNRKPNKMKTRNRLITIVSSIALTAFCAIGISSASARPRLSYSLTDLGVLPEQPDSIPAAVNNQGQVAGTSGASAFRYTSTRKKPMEDVSRNAAKGVNRGFGINGSGVVVGDSTFGRDLSHAAVFSNGSVTDLGTLNGGGNFSRANGINASGQAVGSSSTILDGASSRAFIVNTASSSGTMIDIGTLGGAHAQALAINDAGFVTGNSQTYSGDRPDSIHAFIWHAPTGPLPDSAEIASNPSRLRMLDLGTVDGDFSYGTSISSKNHVAGYSTINNVDNRVHAFLYDGERMLDLGSLSGASVDFDFSYALGINAADQVVGYSYLRWGDDLMNPTRLTAFIYSGGVMRNLNDLVIDAANDYWLSAATAINDKGQIVAIAHKNSDGALRAVLLTPRPEPLPDGAPSVEPSESSW